MHNMICIWDGGKSVGAAMGIGYPALITPAFLDSSFFSFLFFVFLHPSSCLSTGHGLSSI